MDDTGFLYSVAKLILFIHYLIITSCIANTTIETDQSALIALKSSISYDPQNAISTNWSTSTPVCSWLGVICSLRHTRVSALNISDMNLQGKIPPQLGNLSFLMSLDMSNNSFYGSFPQEFAKLHRLRFINFSNNNLSGPVPSFFSSLPNLKFLLSRSNKFSGSIPNPIANISKLEELDLSRNFLEGKIPQEFGNLTSLVSLNLEKNQLTGLVPLPIFNLSALQVLTLSNNRLTGQLPASICETLPLLKGLYLVDNRFDGTIPSNLMNCEHLQILLLHINEFIGSIPREIGNLTSLKELYLGDNNLEGQIPEEIGNLQKLEEIGLSYSGVSGLIPESIFNLSTLRIFSSVYTNLSGTFPPTLGLSLPNLEYLYLGGNNLSGFIPDSISNASKLIVVDLFENSFTGYIPDSLGNLEFLQALNLGHNRLIMSPSSASEVSMTILTSLTNCRRLRRLVLAKNPLGGKLPTSIGNFSTSLEIFSVYDCRIHGNVPEEIGNLSSLGKLTLFGNELIGNIPTTVKGLRKLQILYLSNNKITGLIPDEICNLENLAALSLNLNRIFGALPECVGNMTSLRYLYLSNNRLNSTLPNGIWRLNDILEFHASSNMLTGHLPPEIGNLKVVTLIDLSMNNMLGNIPTSIGSLQSLTKLSLAHNRLDGPIPDSFGRVLSLEHLDISHNSLIGEIPKSLEALLYLTYFNASFNDLSGEIPSGGPFVNFTKQSVMYNKALCGDYRFQVPPCNFGSPDKSRKKRALHIALYTILGLAMITIVVVGLVMLRCQQRRKDETNQTPVLPHQVSYARISYDEVQEATEKFNESNILGIGAYGSVYKGTLRNGTQVAVKVFNIELECAFKSFDMECEVMRSLRHRNLTKVVSSCTNLDFRALLMEYMHGGSLDKWLYSHNYFLDILQRLNIMIDVACALDYLHNGYLLPVLHCDLKPSNVLLDNELVGHVSDFGISKILGAGDNIVRTQTLATIGYIAPEYGREGLVSTKSDIYSYGILLMETFTRRKPNDDMLTGELSLKQWIKESLPSEIYRVVDFNLLKEEKGNFDSKVLCLFSIMELALKCTEEVPEIRIDIKDVVTVLHKIKTQFHADCGKSWA